MEVWLRQKGMTGTIDFSFTSYYKNVNPKFQVTDKWQKFTCDFVGLGIASKETKALHGPKFSFSGPGTFWMDNCRIYRYDNEKEKNSVFTPGKLMLDELVDSQPETGKKGALRVWDGLGQMSMKSLCSMNGDSSLNIIYKSARITGTKSYPKSLMFAEATGDSPETRMVPWLVVQVTFTEQDYRDLIEYLGAPYDPIKDTPESKPFAYKRYKQRGHGKPWTDSFREIIVEYGNENWHNRFPVFPFWIGFGELSAIHKAGKEYGIFTRYYTEEMIKSPYWESEKLDDKIKICLGGNYSTNIDKNGKVTGYGQEATQANKLNTYEGHALYVGPLWELKQKLKRVLDDDSFQRTLLSYGNGSKTRHLKCSASLMKLREKGFTKHSYVSYEGAPSGFTIKGFDLSPEERKCVELFARSKAIGLSALDCWLDTYRLGWTYHCYYLYGQQAGWSSHNFFKDGWLPSPAFMLMEMRNRHIRGDMLETNVESQPYVIVGDLAKGEKGGNPSKNTGKKKKKVKGVSAAAAARKVSLVNCYSFRDKNRYSIALMSLKLDGNHNGLDFGNGHTPVTLNLPFKTASKITMQTLEGNPRDNNMKKSSMKVVKKDITSSEIKNGIFNVNAATGGSIDGIPPGTMFIYVFEGTK